MTHRTRVAVLAAAVMAMTAGAFAGPVAAGPAAATPSGPAVELLVRKDVGVSAGALSRAAGGGQPRAVAFRPDVVALRVPAAAQRTALERLARTPGVRWAAPNAVVRAAALPQDPAFVAQWHLQRRTATRFGANWEPVHGTAATGAGVTVAVLDSGVTPGPDLTVLAGLDLVDGDFDPRDENGHGTHVAGTIGQATGNGRGGAGVAPGASLLPVRVLDSTGSGRVDDVLAGFSYALARGASVINVSFAAGEANAALCDAVSTATAAGAVVVAATGNERAGVDFPAACPGAVAVSASTLSGERASYSNTGPAVTIAAPGGELGADVDRDGYVDAVLQFSVFGGRPGYYFSAGTSMAAPHVAGAVALVRQIRPDLSPEAAVEVLTSSALDVGAPGEDSTFGAGLLDIAAAVSSLGVELTEPGSPSAAPPPPMSTAPLADTGTYPGSTVRIAGADRYATAAAVSRAGWSGGADAVVLASGEGFADALAAGPRAALESAPLLLTQRCTLPSATSAELLRLAPRRVIVAGGAAAVCDGVLASVRAVTGADVVRVAGADRYATAAAATSVAAPGAGEVVLASGEAFPDALAAATRAGRKGTVLLLTRPCELPAATARALSRLRPASVTVVGGVSAVCTAVANAAASAAGGGTPVDVRRFAGRDRYATAAAIAADGPAPATRGVASGTGFADALSAGPLLARLDSPLLLVQPDSVPQPTREALLRAVPERIAVFGGASAVSDRVRAELELYALPV